MTISPPDCFGKAWDDTEVECSGGYDPFHVALNGSKNRERCGFFNTCRSKTALSRQNEQQRQLVPASQLIRGPMPPAAQQPAPAPWRPPSPPQAPVTATLTWAQQQAQNEAHKQHQHWLQQQQQAWTQQQGWGQGQPPWIQYPQQFQAQAQLTPIRMMPQSYDMPDYLTTTENREHGSFWENLLFELLRGVGKAAGHTLASYFDKVRFRR